MNSPEQLKKLYDKKILGIRNYNSEKEEFNSDDFVDLETLRGFLWEVDDCESDITPAGMSFLENYYGLEELAKKLVASGFHLPNMKGKAQKERVASFGEWLKSLVPMETTSFIAQSQGTIEEGATLKDELLPPHHLPNQ